MKKVYIKPMIESAVFLYETQPLMHSDHHIGAKGIDFEPDETDGENNNMEIKNLWDD